MIINIYQYITMNIESSAYEHFISTTIDIMDYKIQDVSADGACLYRCVARFIYDNYDKLEDIVRRNNLNGIVSIMDKKPTEYDWYIETDLAKELQTIAVSWLIDHNNDYIDEQGCYIKDIIELCHDIEYEKYTKLYKIFAGDNDYYLNDTGKVYRRGKRKGEPIYEKIRIPTRWGGLPEEYAFHKILDINIYIYMLRKYDKKTDAAVKSNIIKDARLSLVSNIGETGYLDAEFLLLDKKENHFMYLTKWP